MQESHNIVIMSNHCICSAHQANTNQDFAKALDQDVAYHDSCPYSFLSDDLQEQCLSDAAFDSFTLPTIPNIEWADLENEMINYPTATVEASTLKTQATAEPQEVTHQSQGEQEQLGQIVRRLEQRTEQLEKQLENLQNE